MLATYLLLESIILLKCVSIVNIRSVWTVNKQFKQPTNAQILSCESHVNLGVSSLHSTSHLSGVVGLVTGLR